MDAGQLSFLVGVGGIVYLIWFLSLLQIFTKAGERGWTAIIPIYNTFVITRIARQPVWMFVLLLVPVVNVIAWLVINIELGKAFGKSAAFSIFALWLFSYFGYMYLGWGQAKYQTEALSN